MRMHSALARFLQHTLQAKMKLPVYILLLVWWAVPGRVCAQPTFSEGVLTYKVWLTTTENQTYEGTYTMSFKGGQIRKELALDNGFHDVTLINTKDNSVYTLQEREGKKFAIQLSMDDMAAKQQRFRGSRLSNEHNAGKQLAGLDAQAATVTYADGSKTDILFTREWQPDKQGTYNRFPDVDYMLLRFYYKEESGISMIFEAEKMEASPVASSLFRIPRNYKMISYEEYRQINKQ